MRQPDANAALQHLWIQREFDQKKSTWSFQNDTDTTQTQLTQVHLHIC